MQLVLTMISAMSDLQMKQEDNPVHDVPRATEDYQGDQLPVGGETKPMADADTYKKNLDRTSATNYLIRPKGGKYHE